MKKNLLCGALFNLICIHAQALQVPDTANTDTTSSAAVEQTETKEEMDPPSVALEALAAMQASSGQQDPHKMNCNYNIPVETAKIEQDFVLSWAKHAVTQSFSFNAPLLEEQLQKLQSCYTESGWRKFQTALLQSGNTEIIKKQNLIVSSQMDGQAQLIESTNDQWKITLPIKVLYQNDNEGVVHFLNIYLTVGRKITGNLGIAQMIVTPRKAPLSLKLKSLVDAAQNTYSIMAQKSIDTRDAARKIIEPFFISLLPQTTRYSLPDINIEQQANSPQKKPQPNATRLIAYSMRQTDEIPQKTSPIQHLTIPLGQMAEMEQLLTLNWLQQGSPELDLQALAASILNLQSWVTEQETVAVKAATEKFANRAATNLSNWRDSQQAEAKQWNLSLPLKIAYQSNKNQITQLVNINFSIGWKTSDVELPIMAKASAVEKTSPTIATASNNVNSNQIKREESLQTMQPKTPEIQIAATSPQALQNTQTTLTSSPEPQQTDINCDYRIPIETKVDQMLVLNWAKQAAIQSFNFDSESVDTQLQKLQSCYTEHGWFEFKAALDKSGNIEAIKTQKLTMTSQLDGQPQLLKATDNQWQISLPLKVIYQNDREKVTQLIKIHLTIGRKATGDLGIMQIIATMGVASILPKLPYNLGSTTFI
ncbi:DotI/IcmL family type IV secretion protein [Legionella cardiaca]|uniref:DotI/IcmL family type IV secretion protein n=1 Tax=Legionella cardiaca TaxID=1071983 RepID=A0ABY8ASQ2_9GAMM|nr:DotI/IcmL family type IV secretion protein [Legionella cardiaca]WED43543.1 DotI/IcmL family type IV secretion protein [Legionella cardiaca]